MSGAAPGGGRVVLFRVDGGAAIGLGHAARSATLAAALSAAGCRVLILTRWREGWRDLYLPPACELRDLNVHVAAAKIYGHGLAPAGRWCVDTAEI